MRDKHLLHTTLTALRDNMNDVAKSLVFSSDIKETHAIATVIDKVTASQHRPLSVQNVLWVTHATVEYFYSCLRKDSKQSH